MSNQYTRLLELDRRKKDEIVRKQLQDMVIDAIRDSRDPDKQDDKYVQRRWLATGELTDIFGKRDLARRSIDLGKHIGNALYSLDEDDIVNTRNELNKLSMIVGFSAETHNYSQSQRLMYAAEVISDMTDVPYTIKEFAYLFNVQRVSLSRAIYIYKNGTKKDCHAVWTGKVGLRTKFDEVKDRVEKRKLTKQLKRKFDKGVRKVNAKSKKGKK